MIDINRDDCRYTAQFCEENAWHLVRQLTAQRCALRDMQVLLFSNPGQSVLLMAQRAAPTGHAIIWDYHVVLRLHPDGEDWIFDLDSRLPFPTPTADYLHTTFASDHDIEPRWRALVRLVPAAAYSTRLHSDRSHMAGVVPRDAYPPDPPIGPHGDAVAIDLSDYRDLSLHLDDGSRVVAVERLLADITARSRQSTH